MEITKNTIVGEVVAHDYRAASIFKSHNIDFCCRGNRSIEDVCETTGIDSKQLIEELKQETKKVEQQAIDFNSWDADLLADYIEKKHHRFVERKIPEINFFLHKISQVHGTNHPELLEIERLFSASAHELLFHMEKEEKVLFPYVRKMAVTTSMDLPHFHTIENPIKMMMHEHDTEGERFRKIAALSNNYTPPLDACSTYKVAFSMLKEFEDDLHLHIHLENNILFPKAINAEQKMNYA